MRKTTHEKQKMQLTMQNLLLKNAIAMTLQANLMMLTPMRGVHTTRRIFLNLESMQEELCVLLKPEKRPQKTVDNA